MCTIGVSEGEECGGWGIKVEKFPNLMKIINLHTQAQQTPSMINIRNPHTEASKLLRDRLTWRQHEKSTVSHTWGPHKITADCSPETMEVGQQWDETFKLQNATQCQQRIIYPAKCTSKIMEKWRHSIMNKTERIHQIANPPYKKCQREFFRLKWKDSRQ